MAKNTRLIGTPKVGGGTSRRMRRWQDKNKAQIKKSVEFLQRFPNGRPIMYTARIGASTYYIGDDIANKEQLKER